MLQRYKKNRTSASFLLTKCATFLIKCYWGTFSVPSNVVRLFLGIYTCPRAVLLLRYADSAGFADNRDTDLTWISHLVLDTLSDIK